jgi:hypothetical protein
VALARRRTLQRAQVRQALLLSCFCPMRSSLSLQCCNRCWKAMQEGSVAAWRLLVRPAAQPLQSFHSLCQGRANSPGCVARSGVPGCVECQFATRCAAERAACGYLATGAAFPRLPGPADPARGRGALVCLSSAYMLTIWGRLACEGAGYQSAAGRSTVLTGRGRARRLRS